MLHLYCVHSKSLDHCSRYFVCSDDLTAQDKLRDSLYSGSDLGLFYGAEDDLSLVRICTIEKFKIVSCDIAENSIPLIDIPGVREFLDKVKKSAPAVQNNFDLESLHSGKKKKERK